MEQLCEKAQPIAYETGENLVILVHGFTGSPDDMRELANYLSARNYAVRAVRLAGHGTIDWQNLKKYSYYDWWKSLEDEVKNAAGKYRKVYLIGYSFGGNLSLDLAARYPHIIKGVISLGVSVYMRRELLIRTMLPIYHLLFKHYRKAYVKKSTLSEYLATGSYQHIPTKSIYDFYHFVDLYTKRELHKVTVPALIVHSRDDAVTHPTSSSFVYNNISSAVKELLLLDDVNHNPIRSERKNIIFEKIVKFIEAN